MIAFRKINPLLFLFCIFFFNEEVLANTLFKNKENKKISLNNQIYYSEKKDKDFGTKKLKNFSKVFTKEKINLNYLVDLFISQNNSFVKQSSSSSEFVDIISDFKSLTEKKLIAKGNVFAKSEDTVLFADEVVYDKENKNLFVKGNIRIERNNQYLEAEELNYNFISRTGYFKNVYGIVDFSNYLNDLNIRGENSKIDQILNDDKLGITNVISEDSSQLGFSSKEKKPTFENFKIEKWRFKTDRIDIKDQIWISEKLILTNDPFNKPQLKIEALDFKAKQIKSYILYTSRWSNLILENSIKIPIGPRRIKGDGATNNQKWGLLYDKNQKEGFYILRNLETIYLDKEKKISLNLKPQFLIQRSFIGSLSSLPNNNDSLLSSGSKQDAKFLDYFAIDKDFNANINEWNFNINSKLNTLDLSRLKHALRLKSELSKNILNSEKDGFSRQLNLEIFGNLKEKVWNGSLGEKNIISAYGMRVKSNNDWNESGINKNLSGALSYGYYEAEASAGENILINRRRWDLNLKRSNSYKIWKPNVDKFIDQSYRYSPNVINNGLFLELSSEFDLMNYSDGSHQSTLSFKASPTLILGKLKRNYLDFVYLTISPRIRFKDGGSPFNFDESVDNKVVEINSKFQLFGPILFGYQGELDIDQDSSNYGKLIGSQLSLSINRRAYNIDLYYKSNEKVGGIKFNIHNFKFDGSSDKFK